FYYGQDWQPQGRTNQGTLVTSVQPLPEMTLVTFDGQPFPLKQLHGRWTLLTVSPADCTSACEQNLYKMRQIRIALNQDVQRVQRVLLAQDKSRLTNLAKLQAEYQGTLWLTGDAETLTTLLQKLDALTTNIPDKIYLLDPLGNLLMYYAADTDPKGLLKDLQRLLKLSRIG
ncbi:MAG: hypothetical protein BWK79_12080, partial [Beggiatoa sp. IS2]